MRIRRLHNISNMPYPQAALMDLMLVHQYLVSDEEVVSIKDSQCYMLEDIAHNITKLDKRHLYAVWNMVQDVLYAQELHLKGNLIPFDEIQP